MLKRIGQLLLPPALTDPEDVTRTRKIIDSISIGIVALIAVLLFGVAVFFVRKAEAAIIAGLLLLLLVLSRALVARGFFVYASTVLIAGLWIFFTILLWFFGGVNSVVAGSQVVLTVMSGMLLGMRVAGMVAGLSIAACLVMTILPTFGYAPPRHFPVPPWAAFTVQISGFVLALPALSIAIKGLTEALGTARQEIVQRKKVEQALKESEELYRLTLSNISDAVFVTDEQGAFTFICPNVDVLFGYSVEQVSALNNIQAVLGENLIDHGELEATGEIRNIERCIVDASGQEHDALVSVKRVSIAGGTKLYTCRDVTERKMAEKALVASELRYRLVVENSTDVIWTLDPYSVRFTFVSASVEAMFGYTSEEAVAIPVEDWLVPEFLQTAFDLLQQLADGHQSKVTYEAQLYRKNGTTLWCEMSAALYKDEESGTTQMVGVTRDITERKESQQKLQDSKANLRSFFDAIPESLLLLKTDGTVIAANKCMAERYHTSAESLVGRTFFDVVPQETAEKRRRHFEEVIRTKRPQELFDEPMGRLIHTLAYPVFNNDGVLDRVAMYGADITETRQLEESLRTNELRYRTIVDLSPAGIFVDVDGRFVYANQNLASMLGFASPAEIIGQTVVEYIHPDYHEFVRERSAEIMETDTSDSQKELKYFRVDGTVIDVEVNAAPMDYEGSLGIIVIVNDITDRKLFEQDRLEAHQRLEMALEGGNIGFWDWHIDSGRLVQDVRWLGQLGYSKGEVAQRIESWEDRIHPEDKPIVLEVLQGNLRGDLPAYEVEHRLSTKSGEWKWILTRGKVVEFDESRNPVRMLGTHVDIHERKLSEQALRESEERFRTAFLTSPDAITLSRLSGTDQGVYVDVNDGFCDLTGYTRDEVIGRSTVDLDLWCNPKDRVALLAGLHERGQVANLEARFCLKDRQTKICLISARIVNISGQPHVLAVTRDVDQWKKTEAALRVSEERFRQVAEVAGEWIWEVDETGLFRHSSSAVQQVLGYSPVELVGQRHFWEFLENPESTQAGETALEVFARGELFKRFRSSLVRKDEEIVIVETSGSPILDTEGMFHGYRGTSTDVTERVRAAESQKLLAAVVEHASESIVVTDPQGAIQYVNPAFEDITGYTKEEATGLNPRALKSGEHDDSFYKALWKTITEGNVWQGHFINKKKDGALFEEDATISPLKDSLGEITNYVAVKRDVTKEVSLQRQLAQSQKMEAIGTLAGGIAHDFNNILFGIIGYAELAMDDQPEGSRALQNLQRVLAASERAGEMVKQILLFSRQGEYEKQLLDLTPIVKEGLKFLRGSIPSTIEIRPHIGTSLGKIEADPTQMHQVLMNLCTNAAYAMKDTQGVLTVELSAVTLDAEFSASHLSLTPGKYVELTVSDTGKGISPEVIDHIFEPYFTTKKAGEGTGMGLAVIHGIVTSHGGAVTVYSVPGEGSMFNVFLPIKEQETGRKVDSPTEAAPTGHERILYVDDEQILSEMGQAMLKRLGYEVVAITNPVEALELFRADPQRFDLVITDLVMPKMTGTELAHEFIAMRPGMPMILCTGFGHKFTDEEAKERGFHAIISKPISKREMGWTIRKVLDQRD